MKRYPAPAISIVACITAALAVYIFWYKPFMAEHQAACESYLGSGYEAVRFSLFQWASDDPYPYGADRGCLVFESGTWNSAQEQEIIVFSGPVGFPSYPGGGGGSEWVSDQGGGGSGGQTFPTGSDYLYYVSSSESIISTGPITR